MAELAFEHGLVMLHHADPAFRRGLARHGLLDGAGYRVLHSGFQADSFGARWRGPGGALAEARASGRPYHLDRITGGMPFQSLEGIGEVAGTLRDDPHFLGFQVHEWDNSPLYDARRIETLLLEQGLPLDREHFAAWEGRTAPPYFSGGDFSLYGDLYRPLETLADVQAYLEAYFSRLVGLTAGQVLAVNGHRQLYHAALRLGARQVMAEIGNQVPLTTLQLACARGAARQAGKPYGVYYETWGGSPFGCSCATDFSPWFATRAQFEAFHDMGSVGPAFGSGRSLQRRLLWYAWLAGAAWWSEEWGAENYFTNWEDYPLTPYGQVAREFLAATRGLGPVTPIVPAALVLPPGAPGLDVHYLAGHAEVIYNRLLPDRLHCALRPFCRRVFAPQPARDGGDAHNLTPSPWINCFDVFAAENGLDGLARYPVALSLAPPPEGDALDRALAAIAGALPYRVGGGVAAAQSRVAGAVLVGVFNPLGVTKTADGEAHDPAATRAVTLSGRCAGAEFLIGAEFVREAAADQLVLELPAGAVAVAAFPHADR